MTTIPDDIMNRARAALMSPISESDPWGDRVRAVAISLLAERERAIEDERERCAKICEEHGPATQDMTSTLICEALDEAAFAIRSQR
jgi:hypothetical protein